MLVESREVTKVFLDRVPVVKIESGNWPLRSRLLASLGFLIGADIRINNVRVYDQIKK